MQVFAEHESDLTFGARLDQLVLGKADIAAIRHLHGVGQKTEIRLVHVEHFLHGAAGHADFLANHALAQGFAALQKSQRNAVGLVEGQGRVAAGQRLQGLAAAQGVEQLVAERLDQMGVHDGALCVRE
ncbi:hypothetical protein D3C79_857580 [compost metagenome]